MPRVHYWELALYNAGTLVGKWFDLDGKSKDEHEDELQEWMDEVAEKYNVEDDDNYGEEWILGDVEDVPDDMHSEFRINDKFFELEEFKSNNPHIKPEIIEAAQDLSIELDKIDERYEGEWESDEDYAEHYAEEHMEIPENLKNYINLTALARDLMMDIADSNGHYFRTY